MSPIYENISKQYVFDFTNISYFIYEINVYTVDCFPFINKYTWFYNKTLKFVKAKRVMGKCTG